MDGTNVNLPEGAPKEPLSVAALQKAARGGGCLKILGVVFLVLVVLVVAGVGILAVFSTKGGKEASSYVDKVVPPIAATWNLDGLNQNATKSLIDALGTNETGERLFAGLAEKMGRLTKSEPAEGEVGVTMTADGNITYGKYTIQATFEKAEGKIDVEIVKVDGQWKINTFHVRSPALLP